MFYNFPFFTISNCIFVFFNFYIDNQYSHLKVWKNSKLLGEIKQLIW